MVKWREKMEVVGKGLMVLEIESIKENGEVLGVVRMMMMEGLMKKMGGLKGVRKELIVEEGWKGVCWGKMGE